MPTIPGLPDLGKNDGNNNGEQSSGEQGGSDGDMEGQPGQLPSGGPLRTANSGEENTDEDGDGEDGRANQRSGDERESGSTVGAETGTDVGGLPSSGGGEQQEGGQDVAVEGTPGAGIADDGGSPDEHSTWEVSNNLPEQEKTRAASQSDDETLAEGEAKSAADLELERTLAGIDGRIRANREDQEDKLNERAGGPQLPDMSDGISETGPSGDEQGSDSSGPTGAVGGTNPDVFEGLGEGGPKKGNESTPPEVPKPSVIGDNDIPDAKDDDVIARQLREAALAEKDPKLQAALWEELRRYLAKRK